MYNISKKTFNGVIIFFVLCGIHTISFADDKWPLYMAPLAAAANTAAYNQCLEEQYELCDDTLDYCMLTVDEKISIALKECYNIQVSCLKTCKSSYEQCKDSATTPEAIIQCGWYYQGCQDNCNQTGSNCVTRAMRYPFECNPEQCLKDYGACYIEGVEYCKQRWL